LPDALQNVAPNKLEDRIFILQADIRTLTAARLEEHKLFKFPEYFDVISVNPPYFRHSEGKLNSNYQKSIARHEISLSLPELFSTCRKFLRSGGRLPLVYLHVRETEILRELRIQGFNRVERRCVLGDLLLIEASP